MRNSVIQAIRASVLLTFLVLVPFAALFGGSRHRIADARKQAPAGAKAVARIAPPAHRPNRPVTTAIPALTEQQQRLKVDVTPRQPEQPPVAIPGHSAVSADLPVGRSPTPESAHSTPEGGADSTQRSGVSSGDDIPTAAFDRFRLIQDRLKILGATYLLLETWDEDTRLYRFCCEAAHPTAQGDVRRFETTDADPLVAMNRVLAEVEAWHSVPQRR